VRKGKNSFASPKAKPFYRRGRKERGEKPSCSSLRTLRPFAAKCSSLSVLFVRMWVISE
jgi:hypothetical protein